MAETEQMHRYLTIQQVCELLQLGERTVYEMCRQGKLPGAAKVGPQDLVGGWFCPRLKMSALSRGSKFLWLAVTLLLSVSRGMVTGSHQSRVRLLQGLGHVLCAPLWWSFPL